MSTLKTTACMLYDQLWNGRRYEVTDQLFHPDFSYPGGRLPEKLAALRGYQAAMPDLRVTVDDLIANTDRVAVRFTISGTDTGGFRGRPPTGRPVTTWAVEHLGFRDGRIIDDWVGTDWLGVLVQLGVVHDPWTGQQEESTIEEHRALVWRAYDATFHRRDRDAARACYDRDYRCHSPLHPVPLDLDAHLAEGEGIVAAFPDMTVQFQDVIGSGDRLVVRHLFTGTHRGALLGIPATGRRVEFSGTDIYRIGGGRIAEEWAQPDIFGLLVQLGAFPTPA